MQTSQFSQQLANSIGHQTGLAPPPPSLLPPSTPWLASLSPTLNLQLQLQQQQLSGRPMLLASPSVVPTTAAATAAITPLATNCSTVAVQATSATATVNTSTFDLATTAPLRCCDASRPIFTDSIIGQTAYSRPYDQVSYQRLATSGVPALSTYAVPYPEGTAAYFPALGSYQPPFYSTAAGLDLKRNLEAGATWPYHSVYPSYEAAFGYPFVGYEMDIDGARRKYATREMTSALKAWLNEHQKNPYPTMDEKIMLAIIAKMTITQVSTWFANARRRSRKENKRTWEPRNMVEEEDDRKRPDPKDLGYLSGMQLATHMPSGMEKVKPDQKTSQSTDAGNSEEESSPSLNLHVPHGPSPEPKIEDSECHQNQSAIFLRHSTRGDYSSCFRTDLTLKLVPESKLSRKLEEETGRQIEKERDEQDKSFLRNSSSSDKHTQFTNEQVTKPPSRDSIETLQSPYARVHSYQHRGTPANAPVNSDTSVLSQFSEYARLNRSSSMVSLQQSEPELGIPPHCIDPMLHYQLNMYPRKRLEYEQMEHERVLRELYKKELNNRLKDEYMKFGSSGPPRTDPHWIELQRHYGGIPDLYPFGLYPSPGVPNQAHPLSNLNPIDREHINRLVGESNGNQNQNNSNSGPSGSTAEEANRLPLATDPMVRLKLACISPEYHAHTREHSHSYLNLHPGQQTTASTAAASNSAASDSSPSIFQLGNAGFYPRQNLIPGRDSTLGLHHPSDILARPLTDQVVHDLFQRQMMMERERFPHPALMAHEEFIRQQQQREREIKVCAREEAA